MIFEFIIIFLIYKELIFRVLSFNSELSFIKQIFVYFFKFRRMEGYKNLFFEFARTLKTNILQNYLPSKSPWENTPFKADEKKKNPGF